jgi:hypothetical protein
MGEMKKRESWDLTECEFREFLIGQDTTMHIRIFLDGQQDQFSKDYLLDRLIGVYNNRMKQELKYYGSDSDAE